MVILRIGGERFVGGRRRPLESFVDALHHGVQPRTEKAGRMEVS